MNTSKIIVFTLMAGFIYSASAEPMLIQQGRVGIDKNENGILEASEPGLEGIYVYTASNATLTDKTGSYSLPVSSRDPFIQVLPPADYMPAIDEYGQPRFYQKLNSKPRNFTMLPSEISEHILLVADPQVASEKEIHYTRTSLESILARAPDTKLIIFLGDLVMNDTELFRPLKESFAELSIPWLTVYGNHDSAQGDNFATKLNAYQQEFGPSDYAWDLPETRLLFLNNVLWQENGSYLGGLQPKQRQLLEQLANHQPKPPALLQLMHIPIQGDPNESEDMRESDRAFLLSLGKGYQHDASVSGHSHIMYWAQFENHWHWNVGTLSGSWWSGGKPKEGLPYALMQDGTPPGAGYFTGWPLAQKAEYLPTRKQALLKVFKPAAFIPGSKWPYQKILLQWLGSPLAEVQYRINQSNWENAVKRRQYNPEYLRLYSDQFFIQEAALANPRKSQNIYEIRLKPQSEATKQEIEIRVLLKSKVLASQFINF